MRKFLYAAAAVAITLQVDAPPRRRQQRPILPLHHKEAEKMHPAVSGPKRYEGALAAADINKPKTTTTSQ